MPSYTVSKNGYNTTTGSFTWADSNINVTLDPVADKPERLYAYTDPNASGEKLYAWTAPSGTGLFYYDSSYNQIQIADNTIYTTTSTIDTSTRTFYLEDGTSISLYNLWVPGSTAIQSGSTINSATSSEISIRFED